ncbi:LapA family protein [Pedobacter immunditicola]|uniref:LapA family protein n=1 Tax=Pedobacter immunditicola TaxID=3133440 RepID=UPI0030ABAB3E
MRTKTIFIIIFTAILTVFLMINTDEVEFDFIFVKKDISKLIVVGVFTLIGFILGYWAAKPKTVVSTYDSLDEGSDNTDHRNTLSKEDKDYIS